MTSGRHRVLGTRNARKKRLLMQLPEHVQRESERRRLQSRQRSRSSSCHVRLLLPAEMRMTEKTRMARGGDEEKETGAPWYILPVIDNDESQGLDVFARIETECVGEDALVLEATGWDMPGTLT